MKVPFVFEVEGATLEKAMEIAGRVERSLVGRSPKVFDPADDVRARVEGKLVRVRENTRLYADKIAEYEKMLKVWDGSEQTMKDLAALLVAYGDSKIDNPAYYGVLPQGATGKYVVFGYRF